MSKKIFVDRFPYLCVCLSCLVVYIPVVFFDFQRDWDDFWMVMNRNTVLGFTWDNLRSVFTHFYHGQYGPLNELVYMAIHSVFGYDPAVYHLYPLLLHIANSCLVMLFIQRLISGHIADQTARRISFVTALLFALHPIHVESIAWISASKIPLYTFFALLAMLAYIRYVRTGKMRFYISALLLFFCSFGSKEQSVVLPITLFLLDWVLGRTPVACGIKNGNGSVEVKSWGYLFLEKMPFLLFAFFAGLITYANQNESVVEKLAGYPFWQRLIFACYSLVEYLGKLVLPINLLYLYPFPMAHGKELPVHFFIYPVIVIAALIVLYRIIRRKDWPVVFGLLFFFINVLLMIHIVVLSRFSIIADRYMYLPSIGIFFIGAWYAVPWLQRMADEGKKWIFIVVACYFLYLGGYAHYRTYVWKNNDTLKKEIRELIQTKPDQDEKNIQLQ